MIDRDVVVWVFKEKDYGIVIKMDDLGVWVKLRNSDEVIISAHADIEILTEDEIEELENS